MAGMVLFSVSMSRDGLIAPESLSDLLRGVWTSSRHLARLGLKRPARLAPGPRLGAQ